MYIISTLHFPQYGLYINIVFFIGIISWFHKDFSFEAHKEQWKSGKIFWKAVIYTLIGLIAGFAASAVFSVYVFRGIDDGMFKMSVHSWGDLLLFTCNTIFLPHNLIFKRNISYLHFPLRKAK